MSTGDLASLPKGWSKASLPDLIAQHGLLSDGDWVESKDQDPDGDVRLTQLADIGDGAFRDRSRRFLTTTRAHEMACTFLASGDVLIARMPDPLGRACIFPGAPQQCVTAVDVCIVRPGNSCISNRWLMHFINSPVFRASVSQLQSGSTRKRISKANLCTIELPVPPTAEQGRIADAVDSYLSRLDDAEATLARVKRSLERYRASVLQAVVEGPWPWVPLGRVLLQLQNGISRRSSGAGTPTAVLRLADVRDGRVSGDRPRKISLSPEERTKYLLKAGDLVFTRVNGSRRLCGACLPFSGESEWAYCDHFIRARVDATRIRSRFLSAVLTQGRAREFIERGMVTTAGQNTVSQRTLENTPIPLPSLLEQDRAVTAVSQCESTVDASAASIGMALARICRLRPSVLRLAFEGRLVDQDPTDKPASVLLGRIRTERAKAPASPKSPRRRGRPRKAVKK